MPGSPPPDAQGGKHRGIEVRPEAVRHARLEAGLSLAEVAGGEMTRAAIHLVETGKMRPSIRTLELIARQTGRPISHFLPDGGATEDQRRGRDQLEALIRTEDFPAAAELGSSLLLQSLPPVLEADVQLYVGRAYVRLNAGRSAWPHLARARELFHQVRDQRMIAEALAQEACALFLCDDPRTLSRAVQAVDACEALRPVPTALHVRTLIHLAACYNRWEDPQRAVEAYERALDIARSEPNIRYLAMIHDGLGLTYQRLGRFSTALTHARRAHALYNGTMDVTDLVRAEHNLGFLLLRQGELDAAAAHLEQSLTLCDERGLARFLRGRILCSLSELHIERGELEPAETRLREALRVADENGERLYQATARHLLGRLHLRRGRPAAANEAFAAAIGIFEELELAERLSECHGEYAEALGSQGRLEDAIEHWRAATAAARRWATKSRGPAALLEEAARS